MSAAGNQAIDAQRFGGALGGCTFPFAERHDRRSGSQKGSTKVAWRRKVSGTYRIGTTGLLGGRGTWAVRRGLRAAGWRRLLRTACSAWRLRWSGGLVVCARCWVCGV